MFRKIFFPFMFVYGFFAVLNRSLYSFKIRTVFKFEKPVISVGNLSTGGTGKTPIVIEISRYLKEKGLNPVVLTRGYKRKVKNVVICDKDKKVRECGDEPLLMSFKNLSVVVGKDRVRSGKVAMENLNPDIFILDDGFQHHRIWKDVNILIVDATKPFWQDNLLPVGNLREPKYFYRYADCFIVTRIERVEGREKFIEKLNSYKKRYFFAIEKYGNIYNREKFLDFASLTGKSVIVMSGLGDNKQFFDRMKQFSDVYGFEIERFYNFPDHYDYTNFKPSSDKIYLTTEKDLVKLNYPNIYGVEYSFIIEDGFYMYLEERLNGGKEPV